MSVFIVTTIVKTFKRPLYKGLDKPIIVAPFVTDNFAAPNAFGQKRHGETLYGFPRESREVLRTYLLYAYIYITFYL